MYAILKIYDRDSRKSRTFVEGDAIGLVRQCDERAMTSH